MLLNKRISVGYFIKQIRWELFAIILFAIGIGALHVHPTLDGIAIPLGVLTLFGTLVSLLLAFRTSQSYERWWEARIVWGAIVNDSRTLVRDFAQFVHADDAVEIRKLAQRQIVWVYALGESLRRLPFGPKVSSYLADHRIQASNIPDALLQQHMEQIRNLATSGSLSDFQQIRLSDNLGRLCDSMGKCERIKNTVFPRSYSVLLQTLIYFFTAMLPFGLDHDHLAVEISLTILVPVMFISIEKTATMMQNPFENTPVDTPMTALAQTIEINLLQAVGETDIPERTVPDTYYQM